MALSSAQGVGSHLQGGSLSSMALSSGHSIRGTFQAGAFLGGAPLKMEKKCCATPQPRPICSKGALTKAKWTQACKGISWVSDEGVVISGMDTWGGQMSKPRKRGVRVGAKWLHGLKGESKTGGTGSNGSNIFDRLGEDGGSKSSTAATAVRDAEVSQNGRASRKADDDFDEDAYAEEEEEEDDIEEVEARLRAEVEASLEATQREPENGAAKQRGEDAKQETSKVDSPFTGALPKKSDKLEELQLGLNLLRGAIENYFSAVYSVCRLLPMAERKAFLETFRGDEMIDLENAIGGDKETFAAGLDGEDKTTGLNMLDETLKSVREKVTKLTEDLDKDAENEFTLVNGRVVPKTADSPPVPISEIRDFIGRTVQEASEKSQEALFEATWRMGDVPRFPELLPPGVFDDVDSEEDMRQKLAEQKLLLRGQAEQMRQELEEKKDLYRRHQEAWAKEGKDGRDPQAERNLAEGERVIEGFEAQIEEEFDEFERNLGLRPPSDRSGQLTEQDYRDIAGTIQKIRDNLEEGLRTDEGLSLLNMPLAESDLAEMQQTYRDMIDNAADIESRGERVLPGAFRAMDILSGTISRINELISSGRIEVVRDRDYLDAVRAYEAARDGSTEDDDDRPVAETPEEVLTAIEDAITSLDYTYSLVSDRERPITANEVVEMQVMDEGLVLWRDELLDRMTNQTQVKALAKLDSVIDRLRPFYTIGAPRPLKPFTGFKDPNAAAVVNAWADLIGEKQPEAPVSPEKAVTSAWVSLFDDGPSEGADSAPHATPPEAESVSGAAVLGTNGIALGDGEPTGSAKLENVMTIGNGIQLDLGAAQADRLTAAAGRPNSRESDPP